MIRGLLISELIEEARTPKEGSVTPDAGEVAGDVGSDDGISGAHEERAGETEAAVEHGAQRELTAEHTTAVIPEHPDRIRVDRGADPGAGVAPHGEADVEVQGRRTDRELATDTTTREVARDAAHLSGTVRTGEHPALSVEVEARGHARPSLHADEGIHGAEAFVDARACLDPEDEAEGGRVANRELPRVIGQDDILGIVTRTLPTDADLKGREARVELVHVDRAAVAGGLEEPLHDELVHLRAVHRGCGDRGGRGRAVRVIGHRDGGAGRRVPADVIDTRGEDLQIGGERSHPALEFVDAGGGHTRGVRTHHHGTEGATRVGEPRRLRTDGTRAAGPRDLLSRHLAAGIPSELVAVAGATDEDRSAVLRLREAHRQRHEASRRPLRVAAGGEITLQLRRVTREGAAERGSVVEHRHRILRERPAGRALVGRGRAQTTREGGPIEARDVVGAGGNRVADRAAVGAEAVVLGARGLRVLPEGRTAERERGEGDRDGTNDVGELHERGLLLCFKPLPTGPSRLYAAGCRVERLSSIALEAEKTLGRGRTCNPP